MSAAAQSITTHTSSRREISDAKKGHRIVHLTSVHSAFDGRIFHKECRSIANAGYDVTLIVPHDRDESVSGVHVRAVPGAGGRLTRMMKTTWAIYCEAVRQDADLYHFHDPELIPVGLLLRLRHKPVVYDVHEDVPADVSAKHYLPRSVRRQIGWIAGVIEKSASRCFTGIVPATSGISRRFHSLAGRTVTVRNFPSFDAAPAGIRPWSQRKPWVVYAGVLCQDRCIAETVEAMSLLPANLSATLRLAGKLSPASYLEEISALPGWNRVRFLGSIQPTEIANFLSAARVGLCLCRPTPGYLESAPTKIFEYMQAGIPVVASNFPAFREIVSRTGCGLLVNPTDTSAISGAIQYLLTHSEEALEMGERGREAVSRFFNWETEERKLLDLYTRLLSASAS